MKKDFYAEIDSALKQYEEYRPYIVKDIDWICNRIDWCYKWQKITPEQMEELVNRACKILKGE